jgi:hypothetical protein
LKARDEASFRAALLSIANNIGSELLAMRHINQDFHSLRAEKDASGRIDAFQQWLSAVESGNSFLLFDDVDLLQKETLEAALPQKPQNILVTTRNPVLIDDLELEYHLNVHHIRLTDLSNEDTMKLASRMLARFFPTRKKCPQYTTDDVEKIS